MYLVNRHAPAIDLETRTSGLQYSINMLNDYGITSIQDAAVDEDSLKAYRALDERGELSLRVIQSGAYHSGTYNPTPVELALE
jgi:predicted amidohydrolase YtcJ